MASPRVLEIPASSLKRRIAELADGLRPVIPSIADNPHLAELSNSGRWTECSIPVGESGTLITVACYYGVSRSSTDPQCAAVNERLLAACLARALSAGDGSYFLLSDTNIPLQQSQSLAAAIGNRRLVDLIADRCPDEEPPPTYKKDGITIPLTH